MESVDLAKVPGQTGSMIINPSGKIVKATGELSGSNSEAVAQTFQQMLQNIAVAFSGEAFKKLVVSASGYNYVITVSGGYIYAVKTTVSES